MTTRALKGPLRVTSWLAGWVDYVIALTLVTGRRLRIPAARSTDEPVMLAAFAPAIAEPYRAPWTEAEPRPQTGPLVKAAEILMLSLSFFIAAHLLAGGTSTASAPNLNPLSLLPEHSKVAEARTVPSAPSRQIEVPAGSFVSTAPPTAVASEAATAAPVEEAAVLATPETTTDTAVASVAPPPAEAPASPVVAEAVAPAQPPPAPAPAPAPQPVATVLARQILTIDEFRAAALAAGWPAAALPELEKVAWCESRYDARAEYLGARGLMQMMAFWFPAAGLDAALWADPVTNLKAAWFAYSEHLRITGDPWGPWTCKP